MLNRSAEAVPPRLALTTQEIEILDRLIIDKKSDLKSKRLSDYLTKVAQLGGYLARANDPPPGNMVMWRGLARLTDIELGFALATETCG